MAICPKCKEYCSIKYNVDKNDPTYDQEMVNKYLCPDCNEYFKLKGLIDDSQCLIGCKNKYGDDIAIYDDSWGKLWIVRSSIHTYGIIRARSFEDAYSIAEDEFFDECELTIDEIKKEYDFKREHKKVVLDNITERYAQYPDDYPNGKLSDKLKFLRWDTIETPLEDSFPDNELFQESYGFRPNGPNSKDKIKHGIYSQDINGDSIDKLTSGLLADLEYTLIIEDN